MKWLVLSAAAVALLGRGLFFGAWSATNNVCKTFEDYYSDRDSNENCYHNPDHELAVPDIIRRYGYPMETHNVTTEDGYILTLFRIPHARGAANETLGRPVFLQHGFASSSSCFVSIGRKSLGFLLADAGYDVWLGNFRGSIYSRGHVSLNESDPRFWDFSVHEFGVYDLPAQLTLVHSATAQKITYIGFSLGTMSMYVYGTMYPEAAAEKINFFINFAPAAYLNATRTITKYFLEYWHLVEPFVQIATNGKIFARISIPQFFWRSVCFPYPFQMKLCQFLDMMTFGFNYEQNDPETLPVTFMQIADWSSVKALTHLVQLIISGNFQMYDYGAEVNKKEYGHLEPPHYNLSRLKVRTYFIRGANDLIITKENAEKLYNSIPKETKPYDIYVVKDENFSHLDFITARDIVPLLYNHVLDFIQKH